MNVIELILVCVCFSALPATCTKYIHHTMEPDRLCPLLTGKRKVRLGSLERSAMILTEKRHIKMWGGIFSYNCHFEVKATEGQGIMAVVHRLQLRKEKSGECLDYIQFGQDSGFKSPRLCGIRTPQDLNKTGALVTTGEIANAFHDPEGEMDVWFHLDKRKLSENESIDVEIVFTAYSETSCEKPSKDYHECTKNVCIWKEYACDGYVNCMHGNGSDELSCSMEDRYRRISTTVKIVVVVGILLVIVFCSVVTLFLRHHSLVCFSDDESTRGRRSQSLNFANVRYGGPQALGAPINLALSPTTALPSAPREDDLPPPYETLFPEHIENAPERKE